MLKTKKKNCEGNINEGQQKRKLCLKPSANGVGGKVAALLAVGFAFVFLFSELMAFTMYVVPLFSTWIAQSQGVGTDANWVLALVLWGFPTLFLVLIFSGLHLYVILKLLKRMFKWLKTVFIKQPMA